MRNENAFLLVFIYLLASSSSFAQSGEDQTKEDDKRRKLIQSLSLDSLDLAIQTRDAQVQEQVSVEAREYPGLNMAVESPASSLRRYKPYTKQELHAYSTSLWTSVSSITTVLKRHGLKNLQDSSV